MNGIGEIIAKLLLSGSLGGIIGLERELSRKPAGLRTNILLAMGTTALSILSLYVPVKGFDPARIASQIVAGVGFIGAGVIIRTRASVHGVTTAATIWTVTAVGMAVGFSRYYLAVFLTLFAFMVLALVKGVERRLLKKTALSNINVYLTDRRDIPILKKVIEDINGEIHDMGFVKAGKLFRVEMMVEIPPALEGELIARIFELRSVHRVENV